MRSLGYTQPLYLLPFDCRQSYDRRIRPALMLQTIRTLQDAGVEPDVWKVEGFDSREDYERGVDMARCGNRGDVSCIVFGCGADERKIVSWLETAASVSGFIEFAGPPPALQTQQRGRRLREPPRRRRSGAHAPPP